MLGASCLSKRLGVRVPEAEAASGVVRGSQDVHYYSVKQCIGSIINESDGH